MVKSHVEQSLESRGGALDWLSFWWCKTYNKPFKDPLLASYTLEELYYEFLLYKEYPRADKERQDKINDIIEGDKIEKEFFRMQEFAKFDQEIEKARQSQANPSPQPPPQNPADPSSEDVEWMKKIIEEGKALSGDTFGDNLEM